MTTEQDERATWSAPRGCARVERPPELVREARALAVEGRVCHVPCRLDGRRCEARLRGVR